MTVDDQAYKSNPCPRCGAQLQMRALVDSDHRVWQKWRYCDKAGCSFDQRIASLLSQEQRP